MATTLIQRHKGYQIHASAEETAIGKAWIPRALISWGEANRRQTIYGTNPCETEAEAILLAAKLATKWIDREL